MTNDEKRVDGEWGRVDLTKLEPEVVELDPTVVEAIHARRRLRQITLRVGEEQIAEARRLAAESGVGYQTIMRRWLAYGASISRTHHTKRRAG
jgi:predicted DNA binding CopG/RHH family protein